MNKPLRAKKPRHVMPREAPNRLDRLGHAAIVVATGVVRLLGVDLASALMGFLWRHLAPYNRRHRRAEANLALAMPHLTAAERKAILGDMWENLGRTAAETLVLPQMIEEPWRFDLRAELEPHRGDLRHGAIFAALHQGNWEFCGWGIRCAGFKTAAVYRPLKNPLSEEFLRSRRLPIYDGGLYGRERATALKLRTLAREGVAIGMLADLRDTTGIDIPFFGHETKAASFPAVLARRLGLPLIVGRVVRTKGARFRIEALRVDVPHTADAEADIEAATRALHAQFERWIAEIPGQWMWGHRKWKQVPRRP